MALVAFENVDVVFGARPEPALALIDAGKSKEEIFAETGLVVGVRDASLAVEKGEIFVLMGLSGSGKSTLVRCANGLNRPTRGRALVDDGGMPVDIGTCRPEVLRRLRMNRISMVFQQFALMPWRTINDNVAFGLELRGVAKTERLARVKEVLELVQLAAWGDKYPHELSGGMQQRVGLARAFATDADILLMDEPFSALDPLIRERLQDELLELQKKLQRTILFVSHDLDEALKIGSRIAIMEGGRIVQVGTPENIITEPASDYVRQFVANVNPLNVLRGATIMRPAAALERDPGQPDTVLIDVLRGVRCRLDRDGKVLLASVGGRAARLRAHDPALDPASLSDDEIVVARPEITMRAAVEMRYATGNPILVADGSGRLVGMIGAQELIAGIVGARGRARKEAADAGTPAGGPEAAPARTGRRAGAAP